MPQMIRKKIKWATKRRKCGTRVWKTKWITVAQQSAKPHRETGQHKGEHKADHKTEHKPDHKPDHKNDKPAAEKPAHDKGAEKKN